MASAYLLYAALMFNINVMTEMLDMAAKPF